MNEPKPVLSVRVSIELIRRIDKLAEQTNVSRADMVERCLSVGLMDEEEFVEALSSPLKGPLYNLFTHPAVLKALFRLTEEQIDSTQQRVRKTLSEKRRSKKLGQAKLAT